MSSIIVNGVATDASLPVDTDLKSYLESHASTLRWVQMDSEYASVTSGRITAISAIGSLGGTYTKAATNGPLIAADADFSDYEAAAWSAGNDNRLSSTDSMPTGSYSIVAMLKRGVGISATGYFATWIGGDQYTGQILHTSAGQIQAFARAGGVTIADAPAYPSSVPLMLKYHFNGVTTLKAQVNKGTIYTAAPSGAASGAAPAITLGQSLVGSISDFVIVAGDIFDSANAQLLADWETYFAEVYGIDLG